MFAQLVFGSMVNKKACQWICVILVSLLSVPETYGFYVDITFLESAVEKGAGIKP